MQALISDIHANLEALCEVLNDIDNRAVDEIVCLGDVVGYGPDPEACVDFIMGRTAFTLKGNHDYALIHGTTGFNPLAAEAIRLTREIMEPAADDDLQPPDGGQPVKCPCRTEDQKPSCLLLEHSSPDRWHFLRNLPETRRTDPELYVHASPLNPVFEYVLPDRFTKGWKPDRLREMFEKIEHLAFCGHTHIPCAIDSDLKCFYPTDDASELALLPDLKYIINTGSVGQPRDGDNRSCYLLYDDKKHTVRWRRIAYDIESTTRKIEAMCGKDNYCATRLRLGR